MPPTVARAPTLFRLKKQSTSITLNKGHTTPSPPLSKYHAQLTRLRLELVDTLNQQATKFALCPYISSPGSVNNVPCHHSRFDFNIADSCLPLTRRATCSKRLHASIVWRGIVAGLHQLKCPHLTFDGIMRVIIQSPSRYVPIRNNTHTCTGATCRSEEGAVARLSAWCTLAIHAALLRAL